ncbi:MAG: C1 family peptidase [Treponema sp.]|nr:C1 family peptidase [Treponema sp.]
MKQSGKVICFLLVLLFFHASFASAQSRGAIFDEQYENLPRRAQLSPRLYEGLPASFSLRQYAPLPGDQGEFSTCVAWAAAYAARTICESIAINRVNKTMTTQNVFSPVHIYRNVKPEDPECVQGAPIYIALDYLRDTGAVRMLDTERSVSFPRVNLSHYKTSRTYPIADYVTLFSGEDRQKQTLITRIVKKSISEGKPVIIGMNTPDSFNDAKKVWRPSEDPERFYYGHAMCVVGYDDNKFGGAFEVLNSWGRKWGNGGYIWIPYQVFTDFVMEAYELIDNISNYSDGIRFDGFVKMEVASSEGTKTACVSLAENSYYMASEILGAGTQISFTVGARESAYVYSFTVRQGADANDFLAPVLLFPQNSVSPLLNYSDSAVVLPGENRFLTMDNQGKKYLITLYAKQALDIQSIMRAFSSSRGPINKRLSAAVGDGFTTALVFEENEAAFTASLYNPRTVAALIVAIETN